MACLVNLVGCGTQAYRGVNSAKNPATSWFILFFFSVLQIQFSFGLSTYTVHNLITSSYDQIKLPVPRVHKTPETNHDSVPYNCLTIHVKNQETHVKNEGNHVEKHVNHIKSQPGRGKAFDKRHPESSREYTELYQRRLVFDWKNHGKSRDIESSTIHGMNSQFPQVETLPHYSDPELINKEFIYNKRKKRELLRNTRKISSSASSSMPIQMPTYYPYIMAEMVPGGVKIRHPSIIAVNGCPAYFIADRSGRCRQVFQYTVQFGQQNPHQRHSPHLRHFPQYHATLKQFNYKKNIRPVPQLPQSPPDFSTSRFSSKSPRLLALLQKTAKKFDLPYFNNQSSSGSSGEVSNEGDLDKLRNKILSALKIKKNKDSSNNESQNSDINDESDVQVTTPDYDD